MYKRQAGTLCHAAEALMEKGGAASVSAATTHGVLSGKAVENISKSPIKEFVIMDTIDIPCLLYTSCSSPG